MKEKVTREENTIGRFTNWLDTLARRAKYEYIENESKHISHACIDEVPEDALRADEIEISYTVSAGESKFEFEAEWLVKAFAELTQTHQRILALLYVEEKTPQEAAAILGCKVDNIYNQQYRAFTVRFYTSVIEQFILPSFGQIRLVDIRTLNQIVKEIQEIDPNTAINKYMLFALIKDRKIPHGNHGNRTVMDFDAVAPSFNELLNFKKGKELPQIRTIRAAVSELREKYPELGIGEEQIRACVQEGRISSIVVGNRRYIAMQSFFEPYNERIMSGYSPSVMRDLALMV